MSKVKAIENSNENFFKNILDENSSIFNYRLFFNININNEKLLNDSYTKESDNSSEIEDSNCSCLLSKELIEELNSSNFEKTFNSTSQNEEGSNDINSLLYFVNNEYKFIPNDYINNIKNNKILFHDNRYERFNKYNFDNYIEKKNIKHKSNKKKIPKEKKKDWICPFCMNLNYAFRMICNRCQIPKGTKCTQIVNNKKNLF